MRLNARQAHYAMGLPLFRLLRRGLRRSPLVVHCQMDFVTSAAESPNSDRMTNDVPSRDRQRHLLAQNTAARRRGSAVDGPWSHDAQTSQPPAETIEPTRP